MSEATENKPESAAPFSADFRASLFIISGIFVVQTVLEFTLPLFALELSGEGSGLALIKGAGFIPNIIFAIFVGVLNDQILKRYAFRGYAFTLSIITALLCAAMIFDITSLAGLAVFMIAFNAVVYAIANAQLSAIRLSVPDSQLSDATATTATVRSVISTAGPAIAGFALLQFGHEGVTLACLFILVMTAGFTMRLKLAENLPAPKPFLTSLAEGWRVLRANRELVVMTVVIVLTNAAEGAFATALILKLKLTVEANAFEIGIVLAAAGVGAVVASRFAAPLRRRLGYRTAFFWPTLGLAVLDLAIALDWPLWAYCILSFFEGAVSLFFAIGVWSYRQESTAAEHMGRIAGLTGAIFKVGMPPVIMLAGVLADAGSLTTVFILAALINISAALFLAYPARWGWPLRG